ncbi:discoidin domain-containing protein [Microbacterium aoyamense]|uniref:Discoidin domain-containing protein n=1 Tax=Microbacterium aoyamense TaxID=344166 RepID=A0ABN2PUB8_9MICO|nr:glycoside hydrolase family 55 protein [Microbacterium aoyamense]
MTTPPPTRRLRRWLAALTGAALVAGALMAAPAATAVQPAVVPANPGFGSNVTIFSPETPVADIKAQMDALAAAQRDAEMSTARHSVYFLPGTYGSAAEPLQFEVGYYTEVAGLGASPADVVIHGAVEVYNRCLTPDNCLALVNFWRTISNLTIEVDKAGQDGCRSSANFWAVSQAVSMRRVEVRGGNLSLMDYCTAGPQYASGGFIADSKLSYTVSGSQQQWLTRNSDVSAGWSNGVWNQVFSGVTGAPSEAAFPDPPYTTVDQTPASREKPYLYVDGAGKYQVRVPGYAQNTSGISWGAGETAGRSIPIKDFFVAKPGDSALRINAALALGKHLIFTPGVYDISSTILVWRPNTVVLGLGHATLTAKNGATPLAVVDVPGVVLAGVTIDAGEKLSPVLLKVGLTKSLNLSSKASTSNPITLSDVYFRVGGPHIGKTTTALEVNADNVLIDHTWVWRGDHGVEGFTNGVNGDTDRWKTNTGTNGAIINGDNVTATGLFVEHFQKYNLLWKGENGRVILYQNELPYDPPTQADWTQPDGTLGYPGYVVDQKVKNHRLDGAGVYVFNQNNPSIITANGFSVPDKPGVKLHHIMTVNLSAGTIQHVVNGTGGQADNTNTGQPRFIVDYPAP